MEKDDNLFTKRTRENKVVSVEKAFSQYSIEYFQGKHIFRNPVLAFTFRGSTLLTP
jgi:hypothetical protein